MLDLRGGPESVHMRGTELDQQRSWEDPKMVVSLLSYSLSHCASPVSRRLLCQSSWEEEGMIQHGT